MGKRYLAEDHYEIKKERYGEKFPQRVHQGGANSEACAGHYERRRPGRDGLNQQMPEKKRTLPQLAPLRLSKQKSGITGRANSQEGRWPDDPFRHHPFHNT